MASALSAQKKCAKESFDLASGVMRIAGALCDQLTLQKSSNQLPFPRGRIEVPSIDLDAA